MECQQYQSYEEDKIHRAPSKTDSSDITNPQWIFQKYKSGLVSTDAPFHLFNESHQVSVNEESSEENQDDRKFRGPYRKYTYEEKLIAVQKIQNGQDVKEVSKQYGIPRRNLLRWRKNGCQRKQGGGRPTDQEMEKILFNKIKNNQIHGEKQIRHQAIILSRSNLFKASKGWYLKFCRRFELSVCGEILLLSS